MVKLHKPGEIDITLTVSTADIQTHLTQKDGHFYIDFVICSTEQVYIANMKVGENPCAEDYWYLEKSGFYDQVGIKLNKEINNIIHAIHIEDYSDIDLDNLRAKLSHLFNSEAHNLLIRKEQK